MASELATSSNPDLGTRRGTHLKTTRRRVQEGISPILFPMLSMVYRRHQSLPPLVLEAMGITHPSIHKSFATLSRIIDSIRKFKGAVAECGVYRGNSLLGMAHQLRMRGENSIQILGFDSFEGFPTPSEEDKVNGTFPDCALPGAFGDTSYEEVRRRVRLLGYSNVELAKGYFEDTLQDYADQRFQIVHLDVDLYQSYMTCLEFFYPRTIRGGCIVFDEYADSGMYPGAHKAIDTFLQNKRERVECFADLQPHVRYFIRKS